MADVCRVVVWKGLSISIYKVCDGLRCESVKGGGRDALNGGMTPKTASKAALTVG
jgi:hypothetical protein